MAVEWTPRDGAIYAKSSGVTAIAADQIGTFEGNCVLDVSFATVTWRGQDRFNREIAYLDGTATFTIETVAFDPTQFLAKLWNVTSTAGSLNNNVAAASLYTIKQTSKPNTVEVLFQCKQSNNDKKVELEAKRSICPTFPITFGKNAFLANNCTFTLLAETGGNLIVLRTEN